MSNRQTRRRYRKTPDRRVWVFSELNHDLRPEQIAKIITTAGLEQARLEAEARTTTDTPGDFKADHDDTALDARGEHDGVREGDDA